MEGNPLVPDCERDVTPGEKQPQNGMKTGESPIGVTRRPCRGGLQPQMYRLWDGEGSDTGGSTAEKNKCGGLPPKRGPSEGRVNGGKMNEGTN